MKGSPKIFLWIVLLVTTFVKSISTDGHAYNDLISTLCQKTPYPSTCETDLRSDPRSSNKPDPKSLTLIMIDILKSNFSDSAIRATKMTNSTHDPNIIRALNKCIECYTFVVKIGVRSAVLGIEAGLLKYALDAMEDAGGEADACIKAFQGNVPQYFVDRTRVLQEISAIAVALVKTLM